MEVKNKYRTQNQILTYSNSNFIEVRCNKTFTDVVVQIVVGR